MSVLTTILLQAAEGSNQWSGILLILAMVVVFYFFMIRPQQRQRKQLKEQREAMKAGDKIITSGGIHGVLRDITNNVAKVEIDKGVVILVSLESIYPMIDDASAKKN